METSVLVCEQIKDDSRLGRVIYSEDLLTVSVFAFDSDPKRLMIQSYEVGDSHQNAAKADLCFSDSSMAKETVRILGDLKGKRQVVAADLFNQSLHVLKAVFKSGQLA